MIAALALLSCFARANVVVLTYHDIVPNRFAGKQWFDTTESEFAGQIRAMRRAKVHFITVDQLYANLCYHRGLPSKPVCLTFADNYKGFLERAYPVLKRYRIPSAMFVHTGFVGSPIGRPKMTWTDLELLDREGLVEVASQTVTHPLDLRELSREQITQEFKNSKRDLEVHLGHQVLNLAYPNGKFGPACERLAREAGYRMAFSEITRPANQSRSLYSVNRYVSTKWREALLQLK